MLHLAGKDGEWNLDSGEGEAALPLCPEYVVEASGVEPLSRKRPGRTSTSVDSHLNSPSRPRLPGSLRPLSC